MKICPMCGQPLGEFDRFCGGCGHSLETAKAVITQNQRSIAYKTEDLERIVQKPKRIATAKKPKTYILPIFTAVSVAVLATAAILLIPKLSKDEAPKQVVQTVEQTTADTPATVSLSGQCGEQVQWSLNNETGALTISGTGEMADYAAEPDARAPWHPYYGMIKSVTITDGVTKIGSYAFFELSQLEQVSIADSVTQIGEGAFNYCSTLEQVDIPKNVGTIADLAFFNCHRLARISVDPANEAFADEDGILFTKDKTVLLQMPAANGKTAYTVPDTVTQIKDRAFRHCETLTQITLPQNLTSIGELAFSRCSALASIQLPEGIGTLEYMLFESCTSLTEVHIPKSVTAIADSVFSQTTALTTVYYADSWAQWETISIGGGNEALQAATVNTVEAAPAPAAGGVSTPSAPTPNATQFSEYCVDLYLSSGILSWNVGTADVPAYEGIRLSSGCTIRIAGTLIDGESGFHTYRASVGSVDGLMIAVDYDGDGYYDLIEIM